MMLQQSSLGGSGHRYPDGAPLQPQAPTL